MTGRPSRRRSTRAPGRSASVGLRPAGRASPSVAGARRCSAWPRTPRPTTTGRRASATPYDELVALFLERRRGRALGRRHRADPRPGRLARSRRRRCCGSRRCWSRCSARTTSSERSGTRLDAAVSSIVGDEDDRRLPLRARHRLVATRATPPSPQPRGISGPRVDDPVLVAFGVHEAVARGLPLQVHTGLGDRDLDLRAADPLHLLPAAARRRDAGPAAALLPLPPPGGLPRPGLRPRRLRRRPRDQPPRRRSVELVGEAMELAPVRQAALLLRRLRRCPSCTSWVRCCGAGRWASCSAPGSTAATGRWTTRSRVVDLIGSGNARRVYGL